MTLHPRPAPHKATVARVPHPVRQDQGEPGVSKRTLARCVREIVQGNNESPLASGLQTWRTR